MQKAITHFLRTGRMGSRKENRKGITPIVSVILLLLVTISIVGFAMLFFQRTAQSAGEAGQQQLQQLGSAAAESFEIVNVDKNKVYVKNRGTANLQNLRFYVDGDEVQTAAPVSIPPNTVGEITLTRSQLAQYPGDKLRVTSVGYADEQKQPKFYDKNTVAYWRFDDGERAVIKDYSGSGNDGTFVNPDGWKDGTVIGAAQTDGKYGKAMSFDGIDEYVTIGSLGIPQNGQATIEGWFYFKDRAHDRGSDMWLYGNFLYQHASTNGLYFGPTNDYFDWVPELNKWYHMALTYSGDTSTAKLYVNGEAYKLNPQPGSHIIPAFPGLISSSERAFNGAIDEVRIYNRALTPAEIQEDMNSPYPIARTVASYSFEKFTTDGKAQDTHNIVKGRYGAAMSFDGVNDYINVGTGASLDITAAITLEAWIKTSKLHEGGIITKDNAADQRNYLLYTTPNDITMQPVGVTGQALAWTSTAYADGSWHHVAGTYDGANTRIYFDGVEKASEVSTGSIQVGTTNLRIGNRDLVTDDLYFNGVIDEVRILNVAL